MNTRIARKILRCGEIGIWHTHDQIDRAIRYLRRRHRRRLRRRRRVRALIGDIYMWPWERGPRIDPPDR